MKKYVKYIIIAIIIALVIISVILINRDKPINRYKREVKSIISEYLNKNIDNDYARKKIDKVKSQIEDEIEKKYSLELRLLASKVSNISLLLMKDDYLEVKQKVKDL